MDTMLYTENAATTSIYQRYEEHSLQYFALKLVSEAGEIAGKLGKWQLQKRRASNQPGKGFPVTLSELSPQQIHDLKLELGDCLWYISQMAAGISRRSDPLGEVAELNLEKLAGRAAAGTIVGSGDGVANRTTV